MVRPVPSKGTNARPRPRFGTERRRCAPFIFAAPAALVTLVLPRTGEGGAGGKASAECRAQGNLHRSFPSSWWRKGPRRIRQHLKGGGWWPAGTPGCRKLKFRTPDGCEVERKWKKGRVRRKSEMQARPLRLRALTRLERAAACASRSCSTIKMAAFNVHRRAATRTKNKAARLFEFEAAPQQFFKHLRR